MQPPLLQDVITVLERLQNTYTSHPMHQAFSHDPFQMLVAVILSQRATDNKTIEVAKKLFSIAPTPKLIATLPIEQLENVIRPIGFFHQKAKALKLLASAIIVNHNGIVPLSEKELLDLPQVGRKTANIMLSLFTNSPQIAVDVHVHRIAHRLGWIQTKTPFETELALTKLIPKKYHKIVNHVFVRHGQEICRPIHPRCKQCPIEKWCQKRGV